jgi:subtilisin-like proprotein convertase family protein
MRRLLVSAAVLLAVTAGPAHAATKTYSTGNIDTAIGASLDRSLTVPDRGPVSFVRVSFRITAPNTSALAISLVSPRGTEVPLVVNRGAGADFGSDDPNCGGILTVLDSDETTNPIADGSAPFADSPYRPEGRLSSLYGQDARGRWTLRITNNGGPAHLRCFTLDVSRDVPDSLSAQGKAVKATLTFTERDFLYERLRVTVVRAGRKALDVPIQRIGCGGACIGSRPVDIRVRDLDGGEPEVLLDLFTGGAHCCSVTLILRWDAATQRYRSTVGYWGNYGRRLVDLDGDGLPEFVASDERFVYTFTAYVFSAAPIQIWSYRAGKFRDVTRRYPKEIEKHAASLGRWFLRRTKPEKDTDLRSYVAAYVADQYLLGRPDVARRALDGSLRHGLLYRGKTYLGWPAGTAFVGELMRDLKKWGYIRP